MKKSPSLFALIKKRFSFSWFNGLVVDIYWAAKLSIIESFKRYICQPEIKEIQDLTMNRDFDGAISKLNALTEVIGHCSIIHSLEVQIRLKNFLASRMKKDNFDVKA
jgi:hypothetical protein